MITHSSILSAIGRTPLMQLQHFDVGPCELYLKLELLNPGGSIKDRIGVSMIERAEARGDIQPGDLLVEATAGNTGIALALIGKQKGYELLFVMPDKMSQEKVDTLKAYGAEVVVVPTGHAPDDPDYWQNRARILAAERGGYFMNQFENTDNAFAHETTTGPEILEQTGGQVDAVVVGVGSGGTVTGLSQCFREQAPELELIVADPVGSVVADTVNCGLAPAAGKWLVEGLGEDVVPQSCDLSFVKQAYSVSDADAFYYTRELLKREGLMTGSSTGCLLAACIEYCQAQTEPKKVVSFACDTGMRYVSKFYSDEWMQANGFG